jgi:primosomal protein N' (replication factor Y)
LAAPAAGDVAGEAIVQSLYPQHYAIQSASAQDYDTFYEREMEFRSGLGIRRRWP